MTSLTGHRRKLFMIQFLRYRVRAFRARLAAARYRNKTLQEVFEDIYSNRMWGKRGDGAGSFNSGSGSGGEAASPYVEVVSQHVRQNSVHTIVDLGCGDFRVGKAIAVATGAHYTGVDITRSLISHLNATEASSSVGFQCLNIVDDALPNGDLYLIRQVLQHLSNQQIATILGKLQGCEVIVTEHIPIGTGAKWNKDKAAGPDIRLYRNSGVFLEHPPFSLTLETLLEVPQPFNGVDAILRTSLIRAEVGR